jgi:hypothetical protein
MFGPNIGSLIIYTSTKANPMVEVNRLTGEKGNQWLKLDTDIGVPLQSKEWVRIIVEATVGDGFLGKRKCISSFPSILSFDIYLGDIAIDDISWLPGITCLSADTTTTTNAPSPPTTYRK